MTTGQKPYLFKHVLWGLLGLVAICGLMKVSNGAGFLAMFAVMIPAFAKNRASLLLWILLAIPMLTVTNGFLAPKGFVFSIGARVAYLLIAAIMIMQNVGRRSPRSVTPFLALFPYLALQALTSSMGYQPIISYLKLILFVFIFLAFYGIACAAGSRREASAAGLRAALLSVACFLILGSVALIPFPGIGKLGAAAAIAQGLSPESVGLFMGVTFQPQTLGPTVGVMSSLLLADLLFSVRRWDPLYLALLIAAPILIFYTSSRTAMGTWLAGMCFTSFVFMCASGVGARWKGKALGALTLAGIVCGIALFSTPQMRDKVMAFAFKTGKTAAYLDDTSFERLTSSRQGLVDSAMIDFRESPLIGTGFQVSRALGARDIRSWTQLLSAPIEKGVWVTAILGEGGIIGFLFFVIFLIATFYLLLTRRAYVGACALFVFLISNLGEFTFFSMTGAGGLMWASVFAGVAIDAQRLRRPLPPWGWQYQMRPVPQPQRAIPAGNVQWSVSHES